MAYTCPTCSGTGKVNKATCPTCHGLTVLVESSQNLTVSWRGVTLYHVVRVKYSGPKITTEDITGLNSPLWVYRNQAGVALHTGMVRQLIAGDITPGTLDVEWLGRSVIPDNYVGCTGSLVIVHTTDIARTVTVNAMLATPPVWSADVGDLLRGSATFQFLEA